MANVYRNTAHDGKRNYECTNVVACVADEPPAGYVLADESLLIGKTQLWIEGGIRYFGWL